MIGRSTLRRFLSRTLYLILLLALTAALTEVAVRIYFAGKTGPRTLLYGTPRHRNLIDEDKSILAVNDSRSHADQGVKKHTLGDKTKNQHRKYAKFFPYEKRITYDVDSGQTIEVRINNHGYRGKDFEHDKKQATLRVVTLGASSTLGYYNRDTETYPWVLEQILNQRCSDGAFEVLNLGVPHLNSKKIAALFQAEGLGYQPDIVLFYGGSNDSLIHPPIKRANPIDPGRVTAPPSPWLKAIAQRSLLARYARYLLEPLEAPIGTEKWSRDYAKQRSEFFLKHISEIAVSCRKRDILFIVANQQKKAAIWWPTSAKYRAAIKGLTYAEEVRGIRQSAARGLLPNKFERYMLIHARLMSDLETWAHENQVPLVDVIQVLDQDRHLLYSTVHLHPDANRMIAVAMADVILEHTECPDSVPE